MHTTLKHEFHNFVSQKERRVNGGTRISRAIHKGDETVWARKEK